MVIVPHAVLLRKALLHYGHVVAIDPPWAVSILVRGMTDAAPDFWDGGYLLRFLDYFWNNAFVIIAEIFDFCFTQIVW